MLPTQYLVINDLVWLYIVSLPPLCTRHPFLELRHNESMRHESDETSRSSLCAKMVSCFPYTQIVKGYNRRFFGHLSNRSRTRSRSSFGRSTCSCSRCRNSSLLSRAFTFVLVPFALDILQTDGIRVQNQYEGFDWFETCLVRASTYTLGSSGRGNSCVKYGKRSACSAVGRNRGFSESKLSARSSPAGVNHLQMTRRERAQ